MADHPRFRNSLRHVREQRRLLVPQVAAELNTSVDKMEKFEAGLAVPSLRQFQHLQEIYGVPDYLLASEDAPQLDKVLLDRRQAQVAPMEISPKGLKAYFARMATAEAIEGIATSLQILPAAPHPTGFLIENIVSRTGEMQLLLDFNPQGQRWISQPELAFRYLRAKVERFGIYCFMAAFPPTDFRGAHSKLSDRSSLILINKRTFKSKARIFTLIHEFAHFLLNLEGVSDPLMIKNEVEKACNQFASRFLLPNEYLDSLLSISENLSVAQKIRFASSRTLLSQGAIAYRLREEGRITDNAYRTWFRESGLPSDYGGEEPDAEEEEEDGGGQGGGNYAYNVLADIGFRPVAILEHAKKQGAIDDVHVAQLINARGPVQDKVFKTAKDRLGDLGL